MSDDELLQADFDACSDLTMQHAPLWARNFLSNIGAVRACLPSNRPLEHRTAVVLGAGPSLDLAGPHLEQWQTEGAFIIATNTAARACVSTYGVRPDMVCCVEPRPLVADHFDGVSADVVLLGMFTAEETVRSAHKSGPVAFVAPNEPGLMPLSYRLGIDPIWYFGCVTVMATSAARYLGARHIVFGGVDGSYTDRMYARGTPFEDLMPAVEALESSHGVMDFVLTVSDRTTPSKTRAPAPARWIENNAGGMSLTEGGLAGAFLNVPTAGYGAEMVSISPSGLAIEYVSYQDASDVVIRRAARDAIELRPIQERVPRDMLLELEKAYAAWDPSESVHADPWAAPMSVYWGEVDPREPAVKRLRPQRALMAQAKGAMLEAVANGLERCR